MIWSGTQVDCCSILGHVVSITYELTPSDALNAEGPTKRLATLKFGSIRSRFVLVFVSRAPVLFRCCSVIVIHNVVC